MTQQASNRELQRANQAISKPIPGFKPVALPALAAAVQAAKLQANHPKPSEPPAILRKEAILG